MRRATLFWGSALGIALLFALGSALLLPYEALRLDTSAERWRAWLLTLWTGGVMCVLFGLSGLLGFLSPVGIREVVDAGSVTRALEERKRSRRIGGGGFHSNFAWWLVSTGVLLIVGYFVAWEILRA